MIAFRTERLNQFVSADDVSKLLPDLRKSHDLLHSRKGPGAEFTGWLDLPSRTPDSLIEELLDLGSRVRGNSDALISIGIGGSYLGIRASLEFLGAGGLPVHYAGHNMSGEQMDQLLRSLKDKNVTVVVISKSGTTTEPALAFRIVLQFLRSKYNDAEIKERVICVTDEKKGALRTLAETYGWRSYPIPDDVGGRFSILTAVGLVPLALAGVDIKALIEGARAGQKEYAGCDIGKNNCYRYAAIRNALYRKGKKIEVLSSFYPQFFYAAEWWKQLFGESEGKNGKGLFPASLIFSTDLHSMGQYMQDGERTLFETFLQLDKVGADPVIPREEKDIDGFNYVAGKTLDFVNQKAFEATADAHEEGGVPNMTLQLCQADAHHLGHLYYFFQKACGVSGYMLGVNPFDQPGVEAYKKKMFALLKDR